MRRRDGFRAPDELFMAKLPLTELALLIFYCRRADKYGRSFCGPEEISKHVDIKRNAIDRANNRLEARGWFAHRIRRFRSATTIVLQVPKRFGRECTFWVPLYVGIGGALTPQNECTFNAPRECTPKVLQKVPVQELTHSTNGHEPHPDEIRQALEG